MQEKVNPTFNSLHDINLLFDFSLKTEAKMNKNGTPILKKEGFDLLFEFELIKQSSGKCPNFQLDFRLITKNWWWLLLKHTKCKSKKKSMWVDSIFYNAKLSIYEIILIMFLFAQKIPSKVIIRLMSIDEKQQLIGQDISEMLVLGCCV